MLTSIRSRVMVSHLTIVFLVIVALGSASYSLLKHHLYRDRSSNLHFIARHVGGMIDHKIVQMEKQLTLVTESRVVEDFPDTARVTALGEYFSRFKTLFPVLGYLDGRGWEEVKVVNGQRLPYLENYGDQDLFSLAKAHPNETLRGKIAFSDDLNAPVVPLIHGIQRYFGDQFVGAVFGKAPLSELTGFLQGIEVGETGYLCLIEHSGRILYYPDPSRVLTSLSTDSSDKPLLRDALSGLTGVGEGELFGVRGLIAYVTVERLNASLLVVLPYAEFMAAPTRLRNTILIVLLVVFVAGLIGSMLLANHLTRPIVILTKAARQISRGEFPEELGTDSDGEIGDLMQTFNQMVRELRGSTVSRNYFERITNNMQEGLLLIGLDGKIRNANNSACNMVGDVESNLVGQDLAVLFNQPASNAESWLQMLLANPSVKNSKQLLKTSAGEDLSVSFVWTVLEDSAGSVREVACLFLPDRDGP